MLIYKIQISYVYSNLADPSQLLNLMKAYIKLVIFAFLLLSLFNAYNVDGQVKPKGNDYAPRPILTDESLSFMNNVKVPLFTDTSNLRAGAAYKILILGNSLSSHGKSPEIGWMHTGGMAATSIETDYAHLLFRKIEAKLAKRVDLRIASLAQFERHLSSFDFKRLDSLRDFNADLIIIQIGENVQLSDESSAKLYQQKFTQLINSFKSNKASIICTTPFFPSNEKNLVVSTVAMQTNCFLVDLSHLSLLDSKNMAINEPNYAGDRDIWQVKGIGIHPGDLGMKNIANEIFITVNAIMRAENGITSK